MTQSSCDLPTSVLERNDVVILPSKVTNGTNQWQDQRNAANLADFYNQYTKNEALSVEEFDENNFKQKLLDDWIYHTDGLLFLLPHIKISDSLSHIRQTLFDAGPDIPALRKSASINQTFKTRIFETDACFSGYGLMLLEALRLIKEKSLSMDQIKPLLEKQKAVLKTYVLANQDSVLSKPPFSLSWLQIKKMGFNRTQPILEFSPEAFSLAKSVRKEGAVNDYFEWIYNELTKFDLTNRTAIVSYAGKLSHLRILPGFDLLNSLIKSKNGQLLHSVMSPVNTAYLGLGSLSFSFMGQRK